MSKTSAKIVLLASSLAVIAGGCAMPKPEQPSGLRLPGAPSVPSVPSTPTPAMPGTGAISPIPGSPSASAAQENRHQYAGSATHTITDLPAKKENAVAQVGYTTPAATPAAACTSSPACPPTLCTPATLDTACTSCGDCNCSQRPHGYLAQSFAGWNAYGIDPQEFLCDGGDHAPRALLRRDDSIAGLNPEDTVVHYTTEAGDIEFQASNRTCLYAPRFASVRKITGAVAGGRAIGAAQFDRPVAAIRYENQVPGLVMTDSTELAHADVARRIDAMRERTRGVPVEAILQPEQAGEVLEAVAGLSIVDLLQLRDEEKAVLERLALAAVIWELDEALEVVVEDLKPPTLTRDESVRGLTIYEFPDAGRLRILKLADRGDALPGEIVTFQLRVENVGDSAVDQVVLVDNLTTRLEYVEDSQTCSVEAEFGTTVNDGQSLKLQWKLADKLEVGDSVTIEFQCKVR